jgi:hypothetical protein
MQQIGTRVCTSHDVLALTALPAMPRASPGATVLARHAQLLFAWADHAALGIAQRVFKARIVTHEQTARTELAANAADWFTWTRATADAEGEALDVQRAVVALNVATMEWAAALFASRAEQWQTEGAARTEREAAAAARVEQLAAARTAASDAVAEMLAVSDDEKAAIQAHWERVMAAVAARAGGIGSSDARPLRTMNALQAAAVADALELGAALDEAAAGN